MPERRPPWAVEEDVQRAIVIRVAVPAVHDVVRDRSDEPGRDLLMVNAIEQEDSCQQTLLGIVQSPFGIQHFDLMLRHIEVELAPNTFLSPPTSRGA